MKTLKTRFLMLSRFKLCLTKIETLTKDEDTNWISGDNAENEGIAFTRKNSTLLKMGVIPI